MKPILSLSEVSFSYHQLSGETKALEHISFDVNPGEFIAIVGPSGCGKSTLLSLIAGLLLPEEGHILLNGKPLAAGSSRIGYMLQKDHLFEWRSILKNILLGPEIQGTLNSDTISKAKRMLKTYGLDAFADDKPSQLSGGMRQRAALIRTLIMEPELLLLDEPFSALDYQTRLTVADDIWKIIKQEQKTAILVTHDLSEAVSMADRILVLSLRPGRLVNDLSVSFENPEETSPMQRRNAAQFKSYFNLIWKELNDHEQ
jgi:NitT/TauT family transport system ATP-binding protein